MSVYCVADYLAWAAAKITDDNFMETTGYRCPPAVDADGRAVDPSLVEASRFTTSGFVRRETRFAGERVRREALALLAVALGERPEPLNAAEAKDALMDAAVMAISGQDWQPAVPPGMEESVRKLAPETKAALLELAPGMKDALLETAAPARSGQDGQPPLPPETEDALLKIAAPARSGQDGQPPVPPGAA